MEYVELDIPVRSICKIHKYLSEASTQIWRILFRSYLWSCILTTDFTKNTCTWNRFCSTKLLCSQVTRRQYNFSCIYVWFRFGSYSLQSKWSAELGKAIFDTKYTLLLGYYRNWIKLLESLRKSSYWLVCLDILRFGMPFVSIKCFQVYSVQLSAA